MESGGLPGPPDEPVEYFLSIVVVQPYLSQRNMLSVPPLGGSGSIRSAPRYLCEGLLGALLQCIVVELG